MGDRRRALASLITAVLLVAAPVAAGPGNLAVYVGSLPDETAECAFLAQLCQGARASIGRTERTPPSRDVLASRQAGVAGGRMDDVVAAARAIERKRGRRLACFDREPCLGLVPGPEPVPPSPPRP